MPTPNSAYSVHLGCEEEGRWAWHLIDTDGATVLNGESADAKSALRAAQTKARNRAKQQRIEHGRPK